VWQAGASLIRYCRVRGLSPRTIVPSDADSFRIDFQDRSTIRSVNQLDVRRPNLEQVDFWQPADDYYNSPLPKDPQHYPANLVDSEGAVKIENRAQAKV
jgi:hypothetical protein